MVKGSPTLLSSDLRLTCTFRGPFHCTPGGSVPPPDTPSTEPRSFCGGSSDAPSAGVRSRGGSVAVRAVYAVACLCCRHGSEPLELRHDCIGNCIGSFHLLGR